MLDLETNAELLTRIDQMLDQLRELLRYATGEAEEEHACPELADQLKHLMKDVDRIAIVNEVLASRPEFQSVSHRQLARPGEPLPAHQPKEQAQKRNMKPQQDHKFSTRNSKTQSAESRQA